MQCPPAAGHVVQGTDPHVPRSAGRSGHAQQARIAIPRRWMRGHPAVGARLPFGGRVVRPERTNLRLLVVRTRRHAAGRRLPWGRCQLWPQRRAGLLRVRRRLDEGRGVLHGRCLPKATARCRWRRRRGVLAVLASWRNGDARVHGHAGLARGGRHVGRHGGPRPKPARVVQQRALPLGRQAEHRRRRLERLLVHCDRDSRDRRAPDHVRRPKEPASAAAATPAAVATGATAGGLRARGERHAARARSRASPEDVPARGGARQLGRQRGGAAQLWQPQQPADGARVMGSHRRDGHRCGAKRAFPQRPLASVARDCRVAKRAPPALVRPARLLRPGAEWQAGRQQCRLPIHPV